MDIRGFYDQIGQDYETVLARMMGKESFAAMLLRSFLKDQTMQELTAAMERGDTNEIFDLAHTLKGLAANLGLRPLYEKITVLVEITRNGSLDGAQEAFAEAAESYGKVVALLETTELGG